MAWLLLAYAAVLEPQPTAYALGSETVLLGPFVGAPEGGDWVLFLVLATAGALVAASIPLRRTVCCAGTAGLFIYVPRIVFAYFGQALRPAAALFVTGVVLIAVSLGLTRLRPRRTPGHR